MWWSSESAQSARRLGGLATRRSAQSAVLPRLAIGALPGFAEPAVAAVRMMSRPELTRQVVAHLDTSGIKRCCAFRFRDPERWRRFDCQSRPSVRTRSSRFETRSLSSPHARDELLPLLMSGKVRVADVEAA